MTFVDDNYDRLYELCSQAAAKVRRQYPMFYSDDLISEGFVWVITHPRKTQEYLGDEDGRRGDRMLYAALRNFLRKWAREARSREWGYELDDEYFYSSSTLKGTGRGLGLLHYVFDPQARLKPPPRDGAPVRGGDPAEGGGWLATLVDVQKAVDSLSGRDRELLTWHFYHGKTYDDIGANFFSPPVAKATVAKRIDQAVSKVQEFLGGPRPKYDPPEEDWGNSWEHGYVGTRRAISNAHARAITDNQEHAAQHVGVRS